MSIIAEKYQGYLKITHNQLKIFFTVYFYISIHNQFIKKIKLRYGIWLAWQVLIWRNS